MIFRDENFARFKWLDFINSNEIYSWSTTWLWNDELCFNFHSSSKYSDVEKVANRLSMSIYWLEELSKTDKNIDAFDDADSLWFSLYRFEINSIHEQFSIWLLNRVEMSFSLFERHDENWKFIRSNDRSWYYNEEVNWLRLNEERRW